MFFERVPLFVFQQVFSKNVFFDFSLNTAIYYNIAKLNVFLQPIGNDIRNIYKPSRKNIPILGFACGS